ncbi:MAG TPA: helix-turn-helix domain-containing protein, partial [Rudaea sp.]|nr:helix-turn-helix domain-containing protein [Rudaea sp.]
WPTKALDAARETLEARGDRVNATHARYLEARRQLLFGHLDKAEQTLAGLDPANLPPAFRAMHELIVAGIAMRRVRAAAARAALIRAESAARRSGIAALMAEVEGIAAVLDAPAVRSITRHEERVLRLDDVETLFASNALVVDACRYIVRDAHTAILLARRPVLFTIARTLGEAWPQDVPRDVLVAKAFRGRRADESYRARLRVEIGRLRKELRPIADITATKRGFALAPHRNAEVVVLAQPAESRHAEVLALLADGEWWSSSALGLALGTGQRTMQRALDALAAAGKVHAFGRGRARRWTTPPMPGFATTLLLPARLGGD